MVRPAGTESQPRSCGRARGIIRRGEAVAEVEQIDLPAEIAEFGNHAPVVGVTAGRGRKIAGHGECETLHHKFASYQARATCDSEMVTRIALSSRPSRPSSPARALLARLIENVLGEKFSGRVAALEVRHVVEIAIVQGAQYGLERVVGAADVDHDPVAVERFGDEGCVDDEGRAVQRLGRAEDGAAE